MLVAEVLDYSVEVMIKRKQIENKIWIYLHEEIDEQYTRGFISSMREMLTWNADSNLFSNMNDFLCE